MHGHHFTPQQQTHRWDVPFGVPMSARPVHLVFLFIFNHLLQASKPYRGITFPYQHFSVDTTELFQKAHTLLKSGALIISSVARETLRLLSCHFGFCQHLDCNRRRDLRRTDTGRLVPLNTLTQPLSAGQRDQQVIHVSTRVEITLLHPVSRD